MRTTSIFLAKYFTSLRIKFHDLAGLSGFVLYLIIYNQIITGIMLSFSFVTESMNISLSREEEDAENLYTDDFFFLHERGVDLLEMFLFIHLFRKMYLTVADVEQEVAWKSGVIMFLLLQLVVFTGLVLCCTHLSDITLVIATNIMHTLCGFIGKLYWLLFTDQTLNTDTLTRLGYLHFSLGILVGVYSVYHGVDMHYDWKTDSDFDGIKQQLNWFDEALVAEIAQTLEFLLVIGILCLFLFAHPEALSYELFMWGDIGMITDIRFFGVAPHWYFRPYMSWLLCCPYHYTGILGLILFFVSFYYQPNIAGRGESDMYLMLKILVLNIFTNKFLRTKRMLSNYRITPDTEYFYYMSYYTFLMAMLYAFSYLPYGRFFNRLGGNDATLLTFVYIFIYVSGIYFRSSSIYNLRKTLTY